MSVLCLATPGLNPVFAASQLQSGENDFASEHRLNAHATASAAGIVVEWTSGFETDTLGFNVYRISDGLVSKLNPGLLAGPALIATPRQQPYAWFDSAGGTNSTYQVESVDLRGQPLRRVVAVESWSDALPAYQPAELLSNVGGGRKVTQITNPEWRAPDETDRFAAGTAGDFSATNLPQQWTTANQPALKIGIRADGWYRITQPQMQLAGFDTSQDAANLELFMEGNEVAVSLSRANGALSQSDFIEFWGQGLDTATTDTRVYWLVNGAQVGKRIAISGEVHTSTTSAPVISINPSLTSSSPVWYSGPVITPPPQTATPAVDKNSETAAKDNFALQLRPAKQIVRPFASQAPLDPPALTVIQPGAPSPAESTPVSQHSEAAAPKATRNLRPAKTNNRTRRRTTHRRRHAHRSRLHNHAAQVASSKPAFIYSTEYKPRIVYYTAALNGDRENFFGPAISGAGTSVTLTTLDVERSENNPAQLEVSFQGVSLGIHQVNVLVNGSQAGLVTWSDQASTVQTLSIPNAWLIDGVNTIKLAPVSPIQDVSLIDHVLVTYAHSFQAENDSLQFSVKSTQTARIDGFSTPNLRVLDVTDPGFVQLIHPIVESSSNGFAATVPGGDRGKARRLVAMPAAQVSQPAWLTLNQPSTLNSSSNGADLVIISYKDFIPSLAPVVAQRKAQGFTVSVVDIEDVFDEFSYGEHTPQAIRDFMSLAKNSWARAPSYLLLIGDASYDPRNYLGAGAFDYVPTKLIDTGTAGTATALETASDDWLTDFDNNGIADVSTGRLPVRTLAEANTVIAKIINYSPANTDNRALLVADTQGSYPISFEAADDQVGSILPATMSIQKVYRSQQSSDTVATTNIISQLNAGPAVVVYSGHGNVDIWGGSIFTATEAATLTNGNRLPFVVVMDCLNGYFTDPSLESLAETLLEAPNGGAAAAFASSGLTFPTGQHAMALQMFQLLYTGTPIAIGDASRMAKAATSDMDVRRTWILFGDPTLKIR